MRGKLEAVKEIEKKKLVSVIIVTWNSERFIDDCLASVVGQTYPSLETIVVDNASEDATVRKIKEGFPEFEVIENSKNLGYCRANNQAIKQAKGEYILFMNSDVILEGNYIEQAMKGFEQDEKIGMVSGKILRFDRETIDSTGQFLAKSRKTLERGYGMKDDEEYNHEGIIFSVSGALAFYRKTMIEEIAYPNTELFDEDFFAFHEDIDVGWRGNIQGWKGYYVPGARAYHYRGGTGKDAPRKRRFQISGRPVNVKYHIVKNRYLSIIKNDTLRDYLKDLLFIVSRDIATMTFLLFTSPSVLSMLVKNRFLFARAFRKRRFARDVERSKRGDR